MSFTNIKDLDLLIFQKLNDDDLINILQVNKYTNTLINLDEFWRERLIVKFNKNYKVLFSYKETYKFEKFRFNQERFWNSRKIKILFANYHVRNKLKSYVYVKFKFPIILEGFVSRNAWRKLKRENPYILFLEPKHVFRFSKLNPEVEYLSSLFRDKNLNECNYLEF